MQRYLILGFAVLVCFALVNGCGSSSTYLKNGDVRQTIDTQEDADNFIEAMGIGAPATGLTNETQKKASARNAAMTAAQFELAARVKGIKITGGITIEKAMETDSKIQSNVDAMIKGAKVVKAEWTNDGGCVVTLRISKKALETQMGVKIEDQQ